MVVPGRVFGWLCPPLWSPLDARLMPGAVALARDAITGGEDAGLEPAPTL